MARDGRAAEADGAGRAGDAGFSTEIVRINTELGVAVLFVEQQAELALSIASRGYVLATGAIVLQGTARELLDDPQIQEAYLGKAARE